MVRLMDLALNVVVVVVGGAAIAMISVRLYDRFSPSTTKVSSRKVVNWRDYGSVGNPIGPSVAPVTVVEFTDFQCPYCREAWKDLREIQEKFPKDIKIVLRHFPLPMHQFAADAARASECAGRQRAFEAYHDLLFSSQELIGKRGWEEYARDAGVHDIDTFKECISNGATAALVERDQTAGKKLGVEGTPVLLINDLELPGYPGSDKLKEAVRSEVDRARRHTSR
jgi:protein-disulfide isomerase